MTLAALPGGVLVTPGRTHRQVVRHQRLARLRGAGHTAFVFAGGGSRGAAQVGMLQALVDHGIVPDAVYGASVGALNAAGFAAQPDRAGVQRMEAIWRTVTREAVFPSGRIPGPWRFLQQREAVHSNEGLRQVIETGVPFRNIEEASLRLEVVATSLTDGRSQWFTEGSAMDAILASAALPALLPPVTVDGDTFIDGGGRDNVPIGRAIAQGANRIFVLLCGPLRYTPHQYRRPVEAVLTAFFIAIHSRFTRELEVLPRGVEVVVFSVDSEPVSRYDDFSATDALLVAGRVNAERVLDFWARGGLGEADPAGEPLPEPLASLAPDARTG